MHRTQYGLKRQTPIYMVGKKNYIYMRLKHHIEHSVLIDTFFNDLLTQCLEKSSLCFLWISDENLKVEDEFVV